MKFARYDAGVFLRDVVGYEVASDTVR